MRWSWQSLCSIHPVSLTCGTMMLMVGLFLVGVPFLDIIELKTYDLRFLSRGPVQPTSAVVLALIDEKSLHTEGRWPWPRSKIATLVDRLSQDGAKVIGFDIGFLEPDENSQVAFLQQLRQKVEALSLPHAPLIDVLNDSQQQADTDLALALAMRKSAAAIILGYFFHMHESELNYPITQTEREQRFQSISASKYPFVAYQEASQERLPFFLAYAAESNIDRLAQSAAAAGYFSMMNDRDGIIRWMPLVIQGGEDLFPPLSVATVWHYLGKPQMTVQVGHYGVDGIQMGQRFIPTDDNGQMLINYLGPPKIFPHFSISDILHGQVAPGTFRDKIVLVGATATGIYDLRSTPFSTVYPGVEIHATVIDNILTQTFMTKPMWSKIGDLLAILTLGVLMGIVLPRIGALRGLLFALIAAVVYVSLARWLFIEYRMWLNIIYPLLALATTYTALTVYDYVTEEHERQKIRRAFEHYVAPEVVNEIMQHPEKLNLGGERRVLTVLFSDVQNFTALSELMESTRLVELLNEYLTVMTDIVLQYRGTLDKYIGDAIMAFYGAPIAREDHPLMACYTALGMRAALHNLREQWAARQLPQLNMRIGLHTGEMVVGNMGSAKRFDYTVMGDTVNLASRLEGLNKAYGTSILVTEDIVTLVEHACLLREIDMVQVVGRQQPVRIYELLALAGTSFPHAEQQAFDVYATGMEAYRLQSWDKALELFQYALTVWPSDGPSKTMIERCQSYQQTPPPAGWNGVFEHTHK